MKQLERSRGLKRSAERHSLILTMLEEWEFVSIEAMAERCGTSVQTIRRDLSELEERGLLVRYHGGARTVAVETEIPSYELRNSSNAAAKAAACELLLDLIPDGASLFLAGGSTLAIAARVLMKREGLTIVTNNLHAAVPLYDKAGFNVFVVGGWVRTGSGSLIGDDATSALGRFALDFAIVSASGVTEQGELLEFDEMVCGPNKAMVRNAKQRILVVDRSKFRSSGIVRANRMRDIHHLLTDGPPPDYVRALLEDAGTRLLIPGA